MHSRIKSFLGMISVADLPDQYLYGGWKCKRESNKMSVKHALILVNKGRYCITSKILSAKTIAVILVISCLTACNSTGAASTASTETTDSTNDRPAENTAAQIAEAEPKTGSAVETGSAATAGSTAEAAAKEDGSAVDYTTGTP